ncbi:hypothetical protein IG631_07182 [Alternaria alternata]|jgi:hypothetical protein|nr:hypothetical protein IG631_07182 [Alternaria alternata]
MRGRGAAVVVFLYLFGPLMLLSRGYLRLVAKITYQNQGLGLERNVSGLLDDKPYDYHA